MNAKNLTTNRRRSRRPRRRGTIVVMVAILLPVFVILAAYSINSAALELRRTEMYIAADAAARAGGRELTVAQSQSAAVTKAQRLASLNNVAGAPLSLPSADIVFGTSVRTGQARYAFTAGGANPNAMRITAKRDASSPDGQVALPFPMSNGTRYVSIGQTATSTQVQVDIALVIDRSGSMAYASNEVAAYPPNPASAPPGWNFCDAAPPASRWRDVVAAVGIFNQELTTSPADEYLSLVTYGGSATTDRNLTSNYSLIASSLNVYTNSFCSGDTNIGGGIAAGVNVLANSPSARAGAVKVIVVLTDGIHTTGTNPVTAAASAGSKGVMIFSVTFSNEADQNRMIQVATEGQGKHFHAKNGNELKNVFAEIAQRLPTLLTE